MAILAIVVVPTLSRWWAAGQGGFTWADICSPLGLRAPGMADGAGGSAPAMPVVIHLDHCALCGIAAHMAPPPALVGALPVPSRWADRPPLFLQAPRPLFAWASAQPRAPPRAATFVVSQA